MRALRALQWLCALAIALGFTARASAQEGPYSNYLVGERSMGLAGAFVGLADDPSAIFHNPGGIARLPTTAAAGSLWAVVRGSRQVANGYRTDLGRTDLQYSAPLSLPLFLAGVFKFGAAQSDGVRPHALGLALFTPFSDERRFVAQVDHDNSAVDRLEVRHNDRARWLGVSYGYRLRPGVSLGVSAFWAMRSLTHDEVELRAVEQVPTGAMVGPLYSRASTLSIDTDHAVLRVGMLFDVAPELRAGVMFQPPGLQLADSVQAEHLVTHVGPDPTQIERGGIDRSGANLPIPWELRMGVTWLNSADMLVTLDLSLFGPIGDAQHPLPLVTGENVQLGEFVPTKTYRRASLRGALGFQALIAALMPVRGGVFFERSSTPALAGTADNYALDHVDSIGLALSIGVRTAGYDVSIGSTTVLGAGKALALRRTSDFEADPRYETTSVRTTMLMIYIGGARSAVSNFAKKLNAASP